MSSELYGAKVIDNMVSFAFFDEMEHDDLLVPEEFGVVKNNEMGLKCLAT